MSHTTPKESIFRIDTNIDTLMIDEGYARLQPAWEQLNQRIIHCSACPRLVEWRQRVALQRRRAYQNEEYWGKPVTGFGDPQARVLVVGLAPGAHGANRTGRVFTGDGSGEFLFRALYQAGFANQPRSTGRQDGLRLQDVYISGVCRCAPPANRPAQAEIDRCLPYLREEIALLHSLKILVPLGKIAFDNCLRLYRQAGFSLQVEKFGHGVVFRPGPELPWVVASYHPSRQNTQTGRLSMLMFLQIWNTVRGLLAAGEPPV